MARPSGPTRASVLRVVLDTNVIVSGLLLPGSKPRQALDRAFRHGTVLLSDEIAAELYEVLSRKRLRQYMDETEIHSFLAAFTREGEWVEISVKLAVCRDPKDNKFLELAASGNATHS